MIFKVGDLVSRNSYHNDIVFRIVSIDDNIAMLKGLDIRLCADANISDLLLVDNYIIDNNDELINDNEFSLDRNEYFYLPGSILHIDGDSEYLDRCMSFYKKMKVKANGIFLPEEEMELKVGYLLNKFHPDILVITGHDAKYGKNDSYQNSNNFINCVKEARKFEKNQDKLIIVAGACQSNFDDLIKSGANFASSPKRVNIHALDPAIIAVSLALSEKNKSIDLIKLISKTKFGSDGIGGIITNGTMYVGFPR